MLSWWQSSGTLSSTRCTIIELSLQSFTNSSTCSSRQFLMERSTPLPQTISNPFESKGGSAMQFIRGSHSPHVTTGKNVDAKRSYWEFFLEIMKNQSQRGEGISSSKFQWTKFFFGLAEEFLKTILGKETVFTIAEYKPKLGKLPKRTILGRSSRWSRERERLSTITETLLH